MKERATCNCGEIPHRTSCQIDLERRALQALVLARLAENIERCADGHRLFADAAHSLRWYYRTRAAWSTPRARPITNEGRSSGGGPAIEGRRRTFAAVAAAVRCAEEDEAARHSEKPAPIERWLTEHYAAERTYWAIHELDPLWSLDQIKRRMARAHAIVERRLAEGGWLRD